MRETEKQRKREREREREKEREKREMKRGDKIQTTLCQYNIPNTSSSTHRPNDFWREGRGPKSLSESEREMEKHSGLKTKKVPTLLRISQCAAFLRVAQ